MNATKPKSRTQTRMRATIETVLAQAEQPNNKEKHDSTYNEPNPCFNTPSENKPITFVLSTYRLHDIQGFFVAVKYICI